MRPKIITRESAPVINVLGIVERLHLAHGDTDGAMTVLEQRTPPGMGVPMHVHAREDEVFHVVAGEIELVVGGDRHVLGPGATALAPRNIPHSLRNIGAVDATVLVIVTPAGIERMFEELSELPPSNPPDFAGVAPICARHGVTFV